MGRFSILLAMGGLLACAIRPVEPLGKYTINEGHPGYEAYRQYCAACHGVFADGNGPVAPVLAERPTDLTLLAQRYGRPLRGSEAMEYIDGRRPLRAHGPKDMPVWGKRLFEATPPSAALEPGRRGMMQLILDYLESVQRNE